MRPAGAGPPARAPGHGSRSHGSRSGRGGRGGPAAAAAGKEAKGGGLGERPRPGGRGGRGFGGGGLRDVAPYDPAEEASDASWAEKVTGRDVSYRPEEEMQVVVPEVPVGGMSSLGSTSGGDGELSMGTAGRWEVFTACAGTGVAFLVLSAVIKGTAGGLEGLPLLESSGPALDVSAADLGAQDFAVGLGAAGFVTVARQLLLRVWPEFAESTERSNAQVLPNLGVLDLVWVALLSGIPEEVLFRGTLIPVVAPDLRGVLASALLFGYLHKSGGRNLAFAGWASAVGFLYGSAFLVTGKIAVPAIAHSGANFLSAYLWKVQRLEKAKGGA